MAEIGRHNAAPHSGTQSSFVRGWVTVGFTAIAQFFSIGVGYYTFGVYLKPLAEALDADRFQVALTMSFQTMVMAVLGPLIGRLLVERSIRVLMIVGTLLMSAGLMICSQASELWHLYLGFGLVLSPGVMLTGNLPCNVILANWFTRRRGAAIGISQFGLTISGTVLVPLATFLVLEFGWRTSFQLFAVAVPILLIPLIWFFAIRTPEEVGLHPDGDPPLSLTEAETDDGRQWHFGRAIRTRDIWLISLFAGPCYMAIAAIVLALHSHSTDMGLTAMRASSVVAITTLFGAIAKPLMGTLADILPMRLVSFVAVGLQVAGVGLLLFADSYLSLTIAGGVFGLGYGGVAPLWSLLLAKRFGRRAFARVMGAAMPLTMPFSLIGLPLTTYVFGATGSYLPAFAALLLGYLVSALCLGLLRLPEEGLGPA
jgi:MFS family permease